MSVPAVRKNCPYGTDGTVSGSVLIFRPSDAVNDLDRVAYYVKNGILYKDIYPQGGVTSTLQMTANEVRIAPLIFYVEGALASDPLDPLNGGNGFDYKQPLVTVLLSGSTTPTSSTAPPVPFDFQTSISARDIDNR
jgi:hypothetical protein